MLVQQKSNNCPRCFGRIIVDRHNPGEATCINCGHVAYFQSIHREKRYRLFADIPDGTLVGSPGK